MHYIICKLFHRWLICWLKMSAFLVEWVFQYLDSSVHECYWVKESGPRIMVGVVQHILADISIDPLKKHWVKKWNLVMGSNQYIVVGVVQHILANISIDPLEMHWVKKCNLVMASKQNILVWVVQHILADISIDPRWYEHRSSVKALGKEVQLCRREWAMHHVWSSVAHLGWYQHRSTENALG